MCLSLCILLICLVLGCESKYGCVTWGENKMQIFVSDYLASIPEVNIVRATYRNDINSTGWAYLEIHTSDQFSDVKQAYAAGYLEGFLTRDLIWMHWQNMLKGYCYNKTDVCGMIEDFLDKNEDYISSMILKYPDDPYWYQMMLFFIQLEGLAVGYKEATKEPYEQLTVRDMLWINMLGDLDELAFALSMPVTSDSMLFPEHCTGLVKLLADRSELYTSQVTWNSYQSMLRFQKMYVLQYKMTPNSNKRIPGYKMSMSSYPGFLQILEYARAMIANRLAHNGREWVELFRKHNSGTYNNQWFIVDYNRFQRSAAGKPGRVRSGLLWLLEQLPGHTHAADLTGELVRTSYWPSYNIPYFPRIFNLSGGNERVRVFGDWFGYDTNPRARILKQKQADIWNLADMYHTMRYNDFKHDPNARCAQCQPPYSACNAIAARNDLNPANGSYPFRALGHRSHGGTDLKITSAALRHTFQFVAVSSPTFNVSRGIPPFQWSKFDLGSQVSHVGHPDLWVFPPVLHSWEWS
ncbi:putative phospholipase B-like 2 isoform X2 [Plodia interpunctella]|uniref:putative phospholipase B-like 2 isoform X2 n=1 Tax=Plodia interpunctella TaxID=58824 RepID=UPI002367E4FC|nr:putative phospholipase B-like 2 isoform X2 [Plodia interpunctella]